MLLVLSTWLLGHGYIAVEARPQCVALRTQSAALRGAAIKRAILPHMQVTGPAWADFCRPRLAIGKGQLFCICPGAYRARCMEVESLALDSAG